MLNRKMKSSNSDKLINGFTCGAFDLLHPGHLHLLTTAANRCDRLFVGLHTDPTNGRPLKQKSIQTTYERYFQLCSLSCIYAVIPYDTEQDLENIVAVSNMDKRFLGDDYEGKDFTGKQLCEDRGIELIYIPRKHSWSSSELKQRLSKNKE
jgi:glycerol-3-phosphate cytidylyltransferase